MSTADDHHVNVNPTALHAAIISGEHPDRANALSASLTFGWRGMLKIKHVPEQLFDATIGPILLLVLFTYLFGGAIEGSAVDYLQFLLPGVLVMAVLLTSVYSGVALHADMSKGVVDRFRSLPIWRPAPLLGALLGDALRYAIAATFRRSRTPARRSGSRASRFDMVVSLAAWCGARHR